MKRFALFLVFILFRAATTFAQDPARGFPPYGTFQDGKFDSVNLENLNVNFSIPIVSVPGRGLGLGYAISYNSSIWTKSGWNGYNWFWAYIATDVNTGAWGWIVNPRLGSALYDFWSVTCPDSGEVAYYYTNYGWEEPNGTVHGFDANFYDTPTACSFPTGNQTGYANDGSGYYLDATNPLYPTVYSPEGIKFLSGYTTTLTDTNGNFLSSTYPSNHTDTVGRTALQMIPGSSYRQYQYQDVSGNLQTAQLNYLSFTIRTNFACPGVVEFNYGPVGLPVSLVLANGLSYSFTYEDTPGFPGYTTGRLKRVTLPTGSYYEYQYPTANPAVDHGGINCDDGTTTTLTRVIYDGTSAATWQYNRTKTEDTATRRTWKTVVTAPQLAYDSASSQSAYSFTGNPSNPYFRQTAESYYQGSEAPAHLLRAVSTNFSCNSIGLAICRPAVRTVTLENNQQSKVETDYDGYGNVQETREYDWGSGAPGLLLRRVTLAYLNSAAYINRNILNRITQRMVKDGAGNIQSRADIQYDSTALICVPSTPQVPQHDDTNYGCGLTVRGNPTSVTSYIDPVTPSGALTQTSVFDSLGNLRSITDPGGHTTNFSYADNYSDGVNRSSYAYLTQTTKPTPFNSQTLSSQYNFRTGLKVSDTDENGRITAFSYLDSSGIPDVFNRLRQTSFSDGGQTTISYDDTNRTVTATQKRSATDSFATIEVYNPLAQLVQTQLPGNRKVDVTYDLWGREWKVSNPYITTGDTTYGVVESRFDGLGRPTTVLKQDSNSAQFQYGGNAVKQTDEAGKQQLTQTDALGRVTKVCEVTAGNTRSPAESCGITGFGGTGYLTTYSYPYDATNHLSQTVQTGGGQTRLSNFDGLDREVSAIVIEISSATRIAYGYDNDGLRTSVTDPRGTVSFDYDELHRPKRKKYNGTAVASYSYDGTQANNAIGRLIAERDGDFGSGADETDYTYDAVGRVLNANRVLSGTTYFMAYAYDLMGNMTSLNYPSSSGTRRLVQYAYNSAAELNRVTDATNVGANFDYVSNTNTTYSPLGPLSQLTLGNGVSTTLAWNNRGFLTSLLTQKTGGPTLLSLTYGYFNNGKIQQIANALNNLKSETYTYDDLKRLLTAQRGPDTNIQRKYQYDYDRYGNRWGQTLVAGSGYNGAASFDTSTNRVNSPNFGFDGSGNLTANATTMSFSYNQENFMTAAGTTTYTYDAQGRRVRKTVSGVASDYFYAGSEIISEKQGSNWTDYVFFGDQRIVQQNGSTASTAIYLHPDHLGSTRVCTDASGMSNGTCDYEPFGEFQPSSPCSVPTSFRFTGAQWDSESGLYHFWFRQYDPTQGRWMSVDPLPGSANDPQSLDRYAYVFNDAVSLTDRDGLAVQLINGRSWNCSFNGLNTGCDFIMDIGDGRASWFFFDTVREAFTWTDRFWARNCSDPDADCGWSWHYVYGNWRLLLLLQLPGPAQQKPKCPADKQQFFNWLNKPLAGMASDLGTTKTLMLTLAAKEGGWTQKALDHNMPLNNPFGVNTINRQGQAAGNIHYPSLSNAIQNWENTFGDRVRGAKTPADFVKGLQHPEKGKPYNSRDPEWGSKFMKIEMSKWMKNCGVEP